MMSNSAGGGGAFVRGWRRAAGMLVEKCDGEGLDAGGWGGGGRASGWLVDLAKRASEKLDKVVGKLWHVR